MTEKIEVEFVGVVTLLCAMIGFIFGAMIAAPFVRADVEDSCRDAKARVRVFETINKP